MSLLPPGRFLMPGNLAGSPALTFAPLDVPADGTAPEGSLWAMMERRYEAYKDVVVRPFFREHFARLDRQIVLVDALAAFNAGPEALHDLEAALAGILDCFRIGRSTFLSSLFRPRIDRILFAATKADHLHHSSHDRLEAILRRAVATRRRARRRCRRRDRRGRAGRGARHPRGEVRAAATNCRRSSARRGRRKRQWRDRSTATPRSRPFRATCRTIPRRCSTATAFRGLTSDAADKADFRFLRFRPPQLERDGERRARAAPHPPRPRAAVPDRRPTAMSEQTPHRRPATFKLDDPGVVVVDADEAGRARARHGADHAGSRSRATAGAVEAPLCRRAAAFAGARCSGPALAGLVLLGLGLGVVNLIEDLFARSEASAFSASALPLPPRWRSPSSSRARRSGWRGSPRSRSCICARAEVLAQRRPRGKPRHRAATCSSSRTRTRSWRAPAPRWRAMPTTSSTAPT